MKNGKALVVGGGIGGLATAIALRAKGLAVNIVEIHPNLRSSVLGIGIIQPVNALRALEAIGCGEACLKGGFAPTAWGTVLDIAGNKVGQIPGARIPGSDLPPMNGITRPLLHEILTAKTLEVGATIQYGKTFEELSDGRDGVRVHFDDGTSEMVDFVVGADGVNSKVREYVLDRQMRPVYVGQSAFRYNLPRKIPGEMEIDRIILQQGDRCKVGYVPIGPEIAYIFYNSTWDRSLRLEPDHLDKELRDRLAPFGGITATVRDRYINDPAKVVFRPEEWLMAPPPWHKGRIVLIGDAVHAVTPHLGQGAAQAIEDGVVLADCVTQHESLEEAFLRYTDRRYERCKLVVESSVQLGEWEMRPTPDMNQSALTQRVIEAMLQPI